MVILRVSFVLYSFNGFNGEAVATLVVGMTSVTLYPDVGHVVALVESQKLLPKIGILRLFLVGLEPIIALPLFCPAEIYPVDEVF